MKLLSIETYPFYSFIRSIHNEIFYSNDATLDAAGYWVTVMLFLLTIGVVFLICSLIYGAVYHWLDEKYCKEETHSGTIIDKHYIGEQNSTGTGIASTGNGIGVAVVSSHSDEQFCLFVKDNTVYKLHTTMECYYNSKIGDRVTFIVYTGWLSKESWT